MSADNGTEAPRRQTPTEFARELAMAYATKSVAAKVESVTLKMATVGDLKGQYVLEGLTLVRDPDETLSGFVTRATIALDSFDALLLSKNREVIAS